MLKDIVILGVGFPDIIQTLEDINQNRKTFNIIGFIDDNPDLTNKEIFNYPVLGSMNWLKNKPDVHVINTVARDMFIRYKVIKKLQNLTKNFPNIIHPSVNINHTKIGCGNIISKNSYFEVNSSIGSHCIILPNVTIGHDVSIGNNCFFGPNCSVLGHVEIGENCLIGSGTTILPKIKISKNVTLGINSSIFSNVKSDTTLMPLPSKQIFTSN